MPILAGDIKLVASQVMDDVPEGGGAPTSTIIQDAVSNSIFNDISELDRAGGRVNLRKVFAHIQTPNTDDYLGANVIVAEALADPRVAVTIFKATETFDRRSDARDRIEAYLNKGSLWDGYLLENHIAGQRSIQIFQRPSAEVPPIGRTLYLVANEGAGNEYSQYVRVIDVTVNARVFSYNTGSGVVDYPGNVVTVDLSDALLYDFPGSPPSRFFTQEPTKTKLRDTLVADASKYYGAVKTTAPVAIGAVSAAVASIFTQLVPSAQTETPLLAVSAAGNTESLIDSANGTVSIATSVPFSAGNNIYIGNAAVPGSISIAVSGGTLTDSGGDLLAGTTVIGTVDYARGVLAFASSAPTYAGAKMITFHPAAAPIELADSAAIAVSIENRGYNHSMTIIPSPAPKTLVVSFMAQGKWYDLRDNGAGQIKGADPTFGVGTISYALGTVAVTLGALPDVGSEIIYSWGAPQTYLNRSAMPVAAPNVALQLSHAGITPGSLSIVWNDGTSRTATDDGKGAITGDATGTINYLTGAVNMTLANLPAGGQSYSASYTWGAPEQHDFVAPLRNGLGRLDLDLPNVGDVIPGSVEIVWNLNIETYDYISTTPAEMQLVHPVDPYQTLRDDGLGHLVNLTGSRLPSDANKQHNAHGAAWGTIDYTSGLIDLLPDTEVSIPVARYRVQALGRARVDSGGLPSGSTEEGAMVYRNTFDHWEYVPAGASMPIGLDGLVKVSYRTTGGGTAATDVLTPGAMSFDLTQAYAETIVPGSINFALGGATYFDRLGQLYYNLDPATGAATLAGAVNYQTGAATLSAWVPGQANTLAMHSLLTALDGNPVDEVVFRIPVAPVRPASVQLLATKLTGGTLNVTANTNGNLVAAGCIGVVDYETGVVRARFGSWVTAAGNESAVWYDANAVFNGQIFKPAPVFADSIRYNAVAYSYLPLDADILGLNPVRLPQDGRVPIFRKGDFAVIGHTGTVGPYTVANGQTKDCGRVRLSRVRVIGANGNVINTGYTADLEGGTVNFTDVSGYSQPVTIEHRIEDMAQISDVQINGQLGFTRQITHAYPVGSVVSSALIAGDLHARVSELFDQVTWTNVWSDTPIGSAATGTYNDVLSPVEVTNVGAITERWALIFTSTTAYNVVGEHVGVVASGSTGADCAPINPATNQPYFTIPALGFGNLWAAGNVIRINTIGSIFGFWVVRTIQQGPETVSDDSFTLLTRGDVDRP